MGSPDMEEILESSGAEVLSIEPDEVREMLETGDIGDADLSGMNILVVEDNELNCEIVKLVLEKAGAEVTLANNGRVGADTFSASEPGTFGCVLMDLSMPVMSGFDAARAIRSMGRRDAKTVPIIALSSDAREKDVRDAKEAGMNGHLAKPVDISRLYGTLLSVWNGRQG